MTKKSKHRPHLTPNEVAELLMVNPVTVRQWAARGLLRSLATPGGHRRFLLGDVEEFARSRRLSPVARSRPLRVLIVDEDIQLGQYIAELVRERDPTMVVELAHDGFEAGIKVEAFRPHVLVLDPMMPGIDGREVCRRLRARPLLSRVRIVVTARFPDPESVQHIVTAGADVCLPKPLDSERLLQELALAGTG